MSYLMVHITIAYKLLEEFPDIADRSAFLIGSIAPDAISFRPGCVRSDKTLTHFCTGDEGWGHHTNYDEWFGNLINGMRKLLDFINKDFLLGYMAHIITDIENSRHFWTPTRLKNDKEYMETYLKDCAEIDSILLNKIENIDEMWKSLENSENHFLPEFFTSKDIVLMVEKMQSEIYFNRYPNHDYSLSVLTESMVFVFIDDIVEKVKSYKIKF